MTEAAPKRVEPRTELGLLGLLAGAVVLVFAGIGLVLAARDEVRADLLGLLLLLFLGGLGLATGSAAAFSTNPARARLRGVAVGGLLCLGMAGVALLVLDRRARHRPRTEATIYRAAHLIRLLLAEKRDRGRWPRYAGTDLVLSLVPARLVDTRNPANLSVFWADGRPPDHADPARYRELTWNALGEGAFSDLTDAAGRRLDDPRYHDVPGFQEGDPVPILAFAIRRGVVVAFSDGTVRMLTHEDLGLADGVPITFGEHAPSPLLRQLTRR